MTRIYTLAPVPSLDSATRTPQICPEDRLHCSVPVFEPGGDGVDVTRTVTSFGGKAAAIFPTDGATDEHLTTLLTDEQMPVETVKIHD